MRFRRTLSILITAVLLVMTPMAAFADESLQVEDKNVTNTASEVTTDTDGDVAEDSLASDNASNTEESSDADIHLDFAEPEQDSVTTDIAASDDDLLMQFIDKGVDEELGTAPGTGIKLKARRATRRSYLTGNDGIIYDAILAEATKIATGQRADSVIRIPMSAIVGSDMTITAAELGLPNMSADGATDAIYSYIDFNTGAIIDALLTDCPYEFYWFDKTLEWKPGYYHWKCDVYTNRAVFGADMAMEFPLYVSSYYSASGGTYTYNLNTTKALAVNNMISGVIDIVSANAGKSDYKKLVAYKHAICDLTEYDKVAQPSDHYGDPWQMIYVFDGDDTTKVVCEGYSKAFQYLCDKTSFSNSDVECHSVTGTINGNGHMWNIVHMANDANYHVDVTNCDTGMLGAPDKLFLMGTANGSATAGYTFTNLSRNARYIYDEDTLAEFTTDELTISDTSYLASISEGWSTPTYTYSEENGVKYVTAKRVSLSDESVVEEEKVPYSEIILRHPTCVYRGVGTFTADFNNDAFSADDANTYYIPVISHAWTSVVSYPADDYHAGVMTHTCQRCGVRYTSAIAQTAVVDLPAVKISKPKAGKKYLTAKWKKVSKKNQKKITKIQVQYSTSSDFSSADTVIKTVKKTKTSLKIKKLKSKKYYYVRVRSYKVTGGVKHVSNWSKAKKIKVK